MEPFSIIGVIKRIRKHKGFTQHQMAEKLEMKQSSYGKIERGDVDISIGKLFKILKVLSQDPKDFFSIMAEDGNIIVSTDANLQEQLDDLKTDMERQEGLIEFLKSEIEYYKKGNDKKNAVISDLEAELKRKDEFIANAKKNGFPKITNPPF